MQSSLLKQIRELLFDKDVCVRMGHITELERSLLESHIYDLFCQADIHRQLRDSLHVHLTAIDASISEQRDDCKVSANLLVSLQRQMIDSQMEAEDLRSHLSHEEAKIHCAPVTESVPDSNLVHEHKRLCESLSQLSQEIALLDAIIVELAAQEATVDSRLQDLSDRILYDVAPTKTGDSEVSTQSMASQARLAYEKIKSLANKTVINEACTRDLTKDQHELTARLESLEVQCKSSHERLESLHAKNKRSVSQLDSNRHLFNEAQIENNSYVASISRTHESIEKLKRASRDVNLSILESQAKLDRLTKSHTQQLESLKVTDLEKAGFMKMRQRVLDQNRVDSGQSNAIQCLITAQEETKMTLGESNRNMETDLCCALSESEEVKATRDSLKLDLQERMHQYKTIRESLEETQRGITSVDSSSRMLLNEDQKLQEDMSCLRKETEELQELLTQSQNATIELRRVLRSTEEERWTIRNLESQMESMTAKTKTHPWTAKMIVSPKLRQELETLGTLQRALILVQTELVDLSRIVKLKQSCLNENPDVRELMDISDLIRKYRRRKIELRNSEEKLAELHATSDRLEGRIRHLHLEVNHVKPKSYKDKVFGTVQKVERNYITVPRCGA